MTLVFDTPEKIELFRLATLHKMLKLETLGMTRRGQSAYSIIKQETGLRGSKQKVLDQLGEYLDTVKELNNG
tara:strand:+ start:353 stop:568 length:216 start_codon:yes stop_codon:yes gene_type:complete